MEELKSVMEPLNSRSAAELLLEEYIHQQLVVELVASHHTGHHRRVELGKRLLEASIKGSH
jgi:hypothetical protein